MASSDEGRRRSPRRVIYQRVLPGDVRKLQAASNDSATGGGARDIRFRPWDDFEPVVNRMLPETETEETTRRTGTGQRTLHVGELQWIDEDGQVESASIKVWPPTDARRNEGRLANVDKLQAFAPSRLPPPEDGEVFFLIWEDDDGVWGSFLSESALGDSNAEPMLKRDMEDALDDLRQVSPDRFERANVRGYFDYETGDHSYFTGR